MPYAIRLRSHKGRQIGYQVFNTLSDKGVHMYTYAGTGIDEFGVCRALQRALEHANRLNGVLDGKTSEAVGKGTAQSDAPTGATDHSGRNPSTVGSQR